MAGGHPKKNDRYKAGNAKKKIGKLRGVVRFLNGASQILPVPSPSQKGTVPNDNKNKYKLMSAIAWQVLLVRAFLSPYQSDWRSMNYAESIESPIFPTFHLWVTPQELYLQIVDTQHEKLSSRYTFNHFNRDKSESNLIGSVPWMPQRLR